MIGKTRLLEVFVEQLQESGRHVGSATATEAEGDVLFRAVIATYDRWLSRADGPKQLEAAWRQLGKGVTGRVGKAFGRVLKAAGSELPGGKIVGAALNEVFGALGAADDSLRSATRRVRPLESEEARQLLSLITLDDEQSPIVLVLNQWEEGRDLNHDAATLRVFLRDMDSWPLLHVLLHLRRPPHRSDPNPEAVTIADDFVRAGLAQAISVGRLRFDRPDDLPERTKLIAYLHEHVPATKDVSEQELLGFVDGNPAVLRRWHNASMKSRTDSAELRQLALDAHSYRYPEVERVLQDLVPAPGSPTKARAPLHVALRIAVMPPIASGDAWTAVEPAVLEGGDRAVLDDLRSCGLLESTYGFGHPTRHLVAHARALDRPVSGTAPTNRLAGYTREALESLVRDLVETSVVNESADSTRRHLLLASLGSALRELGASAASRWLATSAATLFDVSFDKDLPDLARPEMSGLSARARDLLSVGLTNLVAEVDVQPFLDTIRGLADAHSSDSVVRENLSRALFNAFNHTEVNSEDAQRRLQELRDLHARFPKDEGISRQLAKALFNEFERQGSTNEQAEKSLDELRSLGATHPGDAGILEPFTRGLFNALNNSERNSERAEGLLQELRTLGRDYPTSSEVARKLSRALFNTFNGSRAEPDRAEGLLQELRDVAATHSQNSEVGSHLAMGLFNAFADSEPNSDRAQGLFDEIRNLASSFREDAAVCEPFARVLFYSYKNADPNSNEPLRLLDDLQDVAKDHRADAAVAGHFAKAAVIALHRGVPSERGLELRHGLHELAALHPGHPTICGAETLLLLAELRVHLAAESAVQAADVIDALVQYKETIHAAQGFVDQTRALIAQALDLARAADDAETHQRLTIAKKAIFGDGEPSD